MMGFINGIGSVSRLAVGVVALLFACLSLVVAHYLKTWAPWAGSLMDVLAPTITWMALVILHQLTNAMFNRNFILAAVAFQLAALWGALGKLHRVGAGIGTAFTDSDNLSVALVRAVGALIDPYIPLFALALVLALGLTAAQIVWMKARPGAIEARFRRTWNLVHYRSPVAPSDTTGHDKKALRDIEEMVDAKDLTVPFEDGGIIIGLGQELPIPEFDPTSKLYSPTAKKLYDLRQRMRATLQHKSIPDDDPAKAVILRVDPGGHMLLFAGSGTGKSVCYYVPILCTYQGGSVVALDVKGELWDLCHERREALGDDTYRLNFQAGDSDAYDALEGVCLDVGRMDMTLSNSGVDSDVDSKGNLSADRWNDGELTFFQLQCDIVAGGLFPEKPGAASDTGDFWRESAAALTSAVIQFKLLAWQAESRRLLATGKTLPRPTLQDAYDVLQRNPDELQKWIVDKCAILEKNLKANKEDPAANPLIFGSQHTDRLWKDMSVFGRMDKERVLPTLTMSISKQLRWIGNRALSDIVCGKPRGNGRLFHADDICSGNTSVFICMNELLIDSCPGVARLVVGSFLGTLFGRSPDETKGYVLFALDECASLKNLELIHRSGLERIRGRKGILLAAFQGEDSLKEAAGDTALNRWKASAMYTIYIGVGEPDAARNISDLLGETVFTEVKIGDNASVNMHIHNPLAGSGGSAGTNRSFDVASYKVKTMAEVAQTPNTFAYVFTRRGTRKPMLVRTCYFGDRTDDIAKWVGKTAFTPTKKKDASPLFLPPSIKRQCEGGADLAASIHNAVLARRRGLLPPPTSPTSPPPPSPKSPSSALLDELNRDDLPLNDEEKRELVEQAADALEFGEPEAAIVGEDFTYGDEQPTDDDLTDVEAAGLAAAIGDNGGGFDESLFLDSVSYSQEAGADEVDPATLAALEPIEDDEMTSPWALAVERLRAERAATNGGPVEELDEIALAELAERQAQAVVEGEPGAADDFDGAPESSDEAAIDAAAQEAEREQALLALALADTPPGVAALQSRLQRARRGGMELGLQG